MATHTFFCRETRCDGEAHISGGRCDWCFEAHVAKLRREHTPLRCEGCCAQVTDDLFNGRWCADCWEGAAHIDGLLFPLTEGAACDCCNKGQRMSNALCVECSKGCENAHDLRAECLECGDECPILALTYGHCPCCFSEEHVCSGAFEYRPEERVCDKSDDPRCPQHIGGWLF